MPAIDCYVAMLSQDYANGLPRVEVYVAAECTGKVVMPNSGQRVPITVITSNGSYLGGLRNNQGKGWPYICPDLKTPNGDDVSLAKILCENAVPCSPNQLVRFNVDGDVWTLA